MRSREKLNKYMSGGDDVSPAFFSITKTVYSCVTHRNGSAVSSTAVSLTAIADSDVEHRCFGYHWLGSFTHILSRFTRHAENPWSFSRSYFVCSGFCTSDKIHLPTCVQTFYPGRSRPPPLATYILEQERRRTICLIRWPNLTTGRC